MLTSAVKSLRRQRAEREKQEPPGRPAIAAAARRLFVERGYARTTIEAIARKAGYAVPTVYFHFGSKAAIVGYLMEQMEAEEIVPEFQKSLQGADPIRMLEGTAHIARLSCERWWDLVVLLRSSGRNDPALTKATKRLEDGRLYGLSTVAEALALGGHLRSDLDARRATDILWTLSSEDTYQRLVVERGWTHDEFEMWLAHVVKRELLPHESSTSGL
jgi:AcrR family transcriptional regulator